MTKKQKSRMMYMHTIDGKPASFTDQRGAYLYFASNGHRVRAAKLVPSLRQIQREQQAAIAEDWRRWHAANPGVRCDRPTFTRYGYVLVLVPSALGSET